MDGKMDLALQLLGIGMLTVFAMLFLVVFIGNMIILFVNKFASEEETVVPMKRPLVDAIDPKKMSAIISAVQTVTGGKGKVVKVEKV
jgi:oxaloacetate decarboxylase (Na+ extruding) subunit gamma